MNNNITTITDQQTMSSLEIAKLTGKPHNDVMKAIRTMEPAWEKVRQGKFSLLQKTYDLPNGGHKQQPYYELTKTECLYVATKFNDEARAKLVIRWEQLEKERLSQQTTLPADPSQITRKQLILMALEAEEEKEKLQEKVSTLEADNHGLMTDLGQKDKEIQALQERTRYLDVIDNQRDTVTISQISQDYGMAAVTFNNLLKGLRIQRKIGDQWILYADFLNKGYVASRMIPIHHAGRGDTFKPMTVWTQIGRRFLYEKLKKHGVLPMIERQQLALAK